MPKKPSQIKSGTLSDGDRNITAKELTVALDKLKASILSQQKKQLSLSVMEDAPRPLIFHKKKEGMREKLATTIDSALFKLVKAKQQKGQQLSHILDSALWNYFGKPKMSFEEESEETKK